ncbi:MAG: helix-turn-helix transcriptional regulator [Chromatocurvus sp.]
MSTQYIEENGRKAYAVLPVEEYDALREKAELHDDLTAYERAVKELERGEDELVPGKVVDALMDGGNAVKVWRGYRGLSQQQLATASGISQAYLAQIELGKREGTVDVYRRLAAALTVTMDDLVG